MAFAQQSASNWTGLHIGAGVGYGMVDHSLSADAFVPSFGEIGPIPDLGIFSASLDYDGIGGSGGLATFEAGFDYQFHGNLLFGVQADYTRAAISTVIKVPDFGGKYELEATESFSLLARAGHIIDDATLMYVIGGWTRTTMNGEYEQPGSSSSYDFKLNGLTIGSGVETALSSNLTAKLEYRYTQYGDIDVFSLPGFLDVSSQSDVQTVRAVLSYHMGQVAHYAGDFESARWTGLHAGIGAGTGMTVHKLDIDTAFGGGSFKGIGAKGAFATLEAGADYQLGERFVLGVTGDYTRSNIATTLDVGLTGIIGLDGTLTASLTASESFSFLARAGVLSSPNVLWYGTGGWTRTTFEGKIAASDSTGLVDVSSSEKQTMDGLTVGAGVEAKLTDYISVKTEYRLTHYEPAEFLVGADVGVDSYAQSVRSVLSYRF